MGSNPSCVAASSSALSLSLPISRRGDTAVRPAGPWEGEEGGSQCRQRGGGCFGSWAPSGPWSFCARGGQGGGGLSRQRLDLCSLAALGQGWGSPRVLGGGLGPRQAE